jgi:hypothetical protein
MLSKIQYNGFNNAMQDQGDLAAYAEYLAGHTDKIPIRMDPMHISMINEQSRAVMNQYSVYWRGWGQSEGGGSSGNSLFYALNSGPGSGGMFGGLGNFLVHLTPFGGIVDFANAAREGNVGGAVLGLASTAAFFTGEGAVNTPMVYRGGSSNVAETFENGFIAKGNNMSLTSHSYGAVDSHFIPTSFSKEVATSFRPAGNYVYTIRQPANGIDLNSKFGPSYDFYHEYELAVPGKISGFDIHGAQQILPNGNLGNYIYNPFYK